MNFEDLPAQVFEVYQLNMNLRQRLLIGSTVKAYLTYLKESGKIEYGFINNHMIRKRV